MNIRVIAFFANCNISKVVTDHLAKDNVALENVLTNLNNEQLEAKRFSHLDLIPHIEERNSEG